MSVRERGLRMRDVAAGVAVVLFALSVTPMGCGGDPCGDGKREVCADEDPDDCYCAAECSSFEDCEDTQFCEADAGVCIDCLPAVVEDGSATIHAYRCPGSTTSCAAQCTRAKSACLAGVSVGEICSEAGPMSVITCGPDGIYRLVQDCEANGLSCMNSSCQ